MGMRDGDPYPVDVTRLKPGTVVGDVVTKPAVPPLDRPPESNYRVTEGE
jgi:hypothetical protein